ncbi:MAG: NAD(P)-dependent oxidoreductase, partial [Proteobacteria bacterium]|nr:NAD(P)-dependent oxidoreductase [Pseudomonadota bacterium]
ARAGDPPRLVADTTRLNTEVGFRPRYDLRAGLADAVAWWRQRLG